MASRTKNYTAFYVAEPFIVSNLGVHTARDFLFYNQLKAWKARDSFFPFNDAHDATYNVRDGSEWETLKARLHQRLSLSKNIILFLSEYTKNSKALREEIDFGINNKGLPIIVVYPDFSEKREIHNSLKITDQVLELWDKLPIFRENMRKVATVHILHGKDSITNALNDFRFKVQAKTKPGIYVI